jgi:hypothetical protein
VSSSALLRASKAALDAHRSKVQPQLVRNGINAEKHLQANERATVLSRAAKGGDQGLVLGYVGSIAPWIDWDALIALSRARPQDRIKLIGPIHTRLPTLPPNIEMLPAIDHTQVPSELLKLDWGLIPFVINRLTEAVDPIKYYEYRASGLPVLTTSFGDMRSRRAEDGVWFFNEAIARPEMLELACDATYLPSREWIVNQDWSARFRSVF